MQSRISYADDAFPVLNVRLITGDRIENDVSTDPN